MAFSSSGIYLPLFGQSRTTATENPSPALPATARQGSSNATGPPSPALAANNSNTNPGPDTAEPLYFAKNSEFFAAAPAPTVDPLLISLDLTPQRVPRQQQQAKPKPRGPPPPVAADSPDPYWDVVNTTGRGARKGRTPRQAWWTHREQKNVQQREMRARKRGEAERRREGGGKVTSAPARAVRKRRRKAQPAVTNEGPGPPGEGFLQPVWADKLWPVGKDEDTMREYVLASGLQEPVEVESGDARGVGSGPDLVENRCLGYWIADDDVDWMDLFERLHGRL